MKCSELVIDVYADDDWKQVSYVTDCTTVDGIAGFIDYVLTMCGVAHEICIENRE